MLSTKGKARKKSDSLHTEMVVDCGCLAVDLLCNRCNNKLGTWPPKSTYIVNNSEKHLFLI